VSFENRHGKIYHSDVCWCEPNIAKIRERVGMDLNDWGSRGFELVAVLTEQPGIFLAIFKRPSEA
jgi:hypothetical protein